jgi:TctA family transporter
MAPGLESALRQSLVLSGGSASIFLTRPIAAGLLLVIVAGAGLFLWRHLRATSSVSASTTQES